MPCAGLFAEGRMAVRRTAVRRTRVAGGDLMLLGEDRPTTRRGGRGLADDNCRLQDRVQARRGNTARGLHLINRNCAEPSSARARAPFFNRLRLPFEPQAKVSAL